jgi:hypothetical protein
LVPANQSTVNGSESGIFCHYDEDDYSYDQHWLPVRMLMMHAPFGGVGYILLGCWIVVALLEAVNPRRFFKFLSFGRVLLPAKLVGAFRVLGVLKALGSVYLIVRYATGD